MLQAILGEIGYRTVWPVLYDHREADMSDDLASYLGILRRPQTDADRGPRVQVVLKLLSTRGVTGVDRDGVRLLAERPDGVTLLIPRMGADLQDARHRSSVQPEALCLVRSNDRLYRSQGMGDPGPLSGSMTCGSVADLCAGRIAFAIPPAGLVPDGVASVELTLRNGTVLTAEVHNNAYELPTSDLLPDDGPIRWLGAGGSPIT
jgi:hypothetical protein